MGGERGPGLPAGREILESGFSVKLRLPRLARMLLEEHDQQCNGVTRKPAAKEAGRHPGPMQEKRPPLVTRDDLDAKFAQALAERGSSPEQARSWPAIIIQTRISNSEQGTSTSPERQLKNIVSWCVAFRFRPVYLMHEEVSGSIYRARRRAAFERFFDDLEHDRIVEPESGEAPKAIVCLLLDRFTRDPDEGGRFLRLFRRKGIDLYESYYSEAPQPLHKIEHQIRDAWNRAAKEVERSHERILNAFREKALRGEPNYGKQRLFGHRAVVNSEGKIVGFGADLEEKAAIERVVQDIIDGATVHSALCWLNENGYTNVAGNAFTYNNLSRLLRACRIAGLVRLRDDASRFHDPTYEGSLYPTELIYDEGGRPDPFFKPAIEPLIPYPTWQKLQAVLDSRHKKRGPNTKHEATGTLVCHTCGSRLVGSLHAYRCPKRHLNGRTRPQGDRAGRFSADGLRHTSMNLEATERLLQEVLFAVVDGTMTVAADELRPDLQARREELLRQLRRLDEQASNQGYLLGQGDISRAQYEEWKGEMTDKRQALRNELEALGQRLERMALPEGVSLRSLWPQMAVERKRQWYEAVFLRVVVRPRAPVGGLQLDRLAFEFHHGYEPPAQELAALVEHVQFLSGRRRRSANRMPAEIEERLLELHLAGKTLKRICETMSKDTDPAISGRRWIPSNVQRKLEVLCRERGISFALNRVKGRSYYPRELKQLMLDLFCQERSWAVVTREVNQLGYRRNDGSEWPQHSVDHLVRRYARELGFPLPPARSGIRGAGRPRHLSEALRERIWAMHRNEKRSLREIGQWLTDNGIKTASGKSGWDATSVLAIVRSVDRDRRILEAA